jgi:heat-inducible transcriptional repressor
MLDERTKEVLRAVIQCYINFPGPVGSRVVAKKYSFGLSPATIRNIMSDLEDMGYLRQPHTSAGRVPTDSGYRFYVDSLPGGRQQPDTEPFTELIRKLEILRRDINSFLDEASRMLSSLSHYIGITMTPGAGTTTLNRIEMIKYRGDQLAVVMFTDEGIIKNKVVPIDPELSQKNLNRIASYINAEFSGLTLDEIRRRVLTEMARESAVCDNLIAEALKICGDVFSEVPGNVFVSGLSEMLALPDFYDINRIKELLKTIDDKHIIVRLLDKISATEGAQVFIGSENPLDEMKQFSLIAATYKEGRRPIGAIGIIGPTRMNYVDAISIVELTANCITRVLSYR